MAAWWTTSRPTVRRRRHRRSLTVRRRPTSTPPPPADKRSAGQLATVLADRVATLSDSDRLAFGEWRQERNYPAEPTTRPVLLALLRELDARNL